MSRSTLMIALILLAMFAAAAGCGGGDGDGGAEPAAQSEPAVPTSTTDPDCGVVPPELAGTYTMETTSDELPPELIDLQVGRWELTLGPVHRLAILAPHGNEIDLSPACVSGSRIAVAEEPAGGACSGYGPSLYEWELGEEELVFNDVRDRCIYNAYVFTGKPWARTAAATSTDAGEDTTATSGDAACGEVPAALAGKWTKTIRPDELPPEIADLDTGVFVMTLGPGHYFRTDVDDNHRGSDTEVCWTATRMAFVSKRDDCPPGEGRGVYAWERRGDELDFVEVTDECFWRPFPTTVRTWKRVS